MEEWEPIDWVEYDDDLDNEERAERLVHKYGFDFDNIPKQEIRELELENENLQNLKKENESLAKLRTR